MGGKIRKLPTKRSASGALIFHDNRLLIVKPTYKQNWEIPGGVVEALESPLHACIRECKEELALDAKILRLLTIDYSRPDDARLGDSYHFNLCSGIFGQGSVAAINRHRCNT